MSKKTRPARKSSSTQSSSVAAKPSSNTGWFAQHPVATAAGIFFIVVLVFFFETIFTGKTYISPDAQAPAALATQLKKSFWEEGSLPQWMPYIFGGMPSVSSLVYHPFAYFPDTVLEFVGRLVPIRRMLVFALHYVLAGLGVFLFLRRRGAGFVPGLFGGLAFMLTPYMITMTIFGHGSQMMTAAYIPLALWAMDRLFEKFSLLNLGLSALFVGLMLQRGHVQVAFYGLLVLGFFLLYQILMSVRRKEHARLAPAIGGFLGATILGFALAAILFLPLQEYTPFSIRGAASALAEQQGPQDTGVGFEYATQWSFSPGEMMTFLVPSFYGFGGVTYWGNMPFTDYPNYMGILVLALAIVALVKRVPMSGFFGLTILFALLLSFGQHFAAFYKIFYNYLPYFNKFRVPVMILVLVQCLTAMLAAMGLHALLVAPKSESTREAGAAASRRLWIALASVLGLVLLLTLAQGGFFKFMQGVYPDRYEPATQQQLDQMRFDQLLGDIWIVALIGCSGLALFALYYSKKLSATSVAFGITLVTVLDLWIVDKRIGEAPVAERNSATYFQPDALTKFLESDASIYRIYPVAELFNELRWAAHGIESVGGYHAAKPRRYQDLLEATSLQNGLVQTYFRQINQNGRPALQSLPLEAVAQEQRTAYQRLLDMLNVKYLVTRYPLPEPNWSLRQTLPFEQGQLLVYENTTMLPRAFLVGRYEVAGNDLNTLTRIRTGAFDPHETVLLAEAPSRSGGTPEPDSTAQAVLEKYSLHEIVIQTTSASPQILVLSDNYYPICWQAFVDDKPVKTLLANYAFRAVEIPAGSHRVSYRYSSRAYNAGLFGSMGAFIIIGILLVVGWRKENAARRAEK